MNKPNLLALCACAAPILALHGQQEPTSPAPGQPSAADTRFLQSKTAPQQDYLVSSQIIGANVRTTGNEEAGNISQLVFDQNGQIHFVIVSSAQMQHLPIPWRSLERQSTSAPPAQFFTVNATMEQLQKAPRFDAAQPAELQMTGKAQEVNKYWGIQGTAKVEGQQPSAGGDSSEAARKTPDSPTTPIDPKAGTTTPR